MFGESVDISHGKSTYWDNNVCRGDSVIGEVIGKFILDPDKRRRGTMYLFRTILADRTYAYTMLSDGLEFENEGEN